MTAAATKKKVTSTKTKTVKRPKTMKKLMSLPKEDFDHLAMSGALDDGPAGFDGPYPSDPAGNSGIPAPAPKGFDGRKVKLLTKTIENRKLPKQAGIILDTLEALGGTATQQQIVDGLIENGLATVQTPKRIYTFYRKDLMEDGFITYA